MSSPRMFSWPGLGQLQLLRESPRSWRLVKASAVALGLFVGTRLLARQLLMAMLYHPFRYAADPAFTQTCRNFSASLARISYKLEQVRYALPSRWPRSSGKGEADQVAFLVHPAAGPPSGGLWVVFGGNAMVGTDWFEFCWMLLSRLPRSGPQPAFLLVDYPGYGANAGEPSPGGALAASIAACHAALPCLPAPPAELHILGHSLGAAAAAQLAARLPSERGAVGALRRGRLVLSAPFLNIEAMAQTIFGKIVGAAEGGRTPPAWALWPLLAHHWDNARQVPRAARAGWDVSIVLGARDEIVPPSMGRALRDMVEQSGGQCNFVEVPRVGHNDVVFKAIPQYAALMGFPAHSPL